MHPQPISLRDCSRLAELQPQDWPDIDPVFTWYHNTAWTRAVKIELDGKIVGVGAGIMYRSTGWIAHIITHPDYRRRGVGGSIVRYLVSTLQTSGCTSISLFATEAGAPLYARFGFSTLTEYSFFRPQLDNPQTATSDTAANQSSEHNSIRPATTADHSAILQLDAHITGEVRDALLEPHLNTAVVSGESGLVTGFFLPSLLEGPILADTVSAGSALLTYKASTHAKITVPSANSTVANLLPQLGWRKTLRARRMQLGQPPELQPEKIFSRIGGNLG